MQARSLVAGLIALAWLGTARVGVAQPPPQQQTVPLNGIDMYVELHGEGEPLVLLHYFTGSGEVWDPLIPDLAEEYRLIVPDLRGHGRSTNPEGEFTHRRSALDVFALLDHLGIDRFRAMGISSGGMTLIHMATQQPARVEAMVLVGSAHYFPDEARAIQEQWAPDDRSDATWARMRELHHHGDEQIRAILTQFHEFKDSYADMNFTRPYLATIDVPTLVVHGDRDAFFPVSIPVEMYTSIPNAYLWIIPNGGHVPIFGDMAPRFAETALTFLEGGWDAR